MDKGKRIQSMNTEFPEPIIQRIQSFLNENQSAQTSILSKSWYSAWLTRPKLVLDERDFQKAAHSFSDFATKTMERYEKSNLKIENFKLRMDFRRWENRSLANELIAKALKIGVFSLDIEFRLPDSRFGINEVEFRYEHLTRLSVTGREIGGRLDGSVSCSRHKPIKLSSECVIFDIVREITWRDSLIEKLFLYECGCLADVKRTYDVKTVESRRQLRHGIYMFN